MRKLIIVIATFLFLQSCSKEPEIMITKDYMSNKHWDERNNAILVEKMKVKKDSVLDIFAIDFKKEVPNHWNVTNKLAVDSTFYFGYSGLNIKKDKVKLKDKIFFNKNNGFEWYSNKGKINKVGELENDTWYKFSKLKTIAYYVYIYVDSTGKVHRFNVNMSNF